MKRARGLVEQHPALLAVAVLAILAIALYATGVLPELPDPKRVIERVATALGPWTYALVAVLAFLETGAFVGLVAPGETTVIAGGVIAGQGEVSLVPLIGLIWVSAVLGDTASFFLGRRLGRSFILRHGGRLRIDEQRLGQVEAYFERHGGKTILVGRFIGVVRALAPFVAGSSGLAYKRFIPFSVLGCGAWASTFAVLGYVFYESFDQVASVAGQAVFGFGVSVAVIVGGVVAYRRLRRAEERRRLRAWLERQSDRRALAPLTALLRPLGRLGAGPARFGVDRLRPGEIGLGLTTALAVTLVGAYVFALLAGALSGGAAPSPVDRELLDLADVLRSEAAVDVVAVLTDLGSLPVATLVLFGACVLLARRRRFIELGALVAAGVTLAITVQLAKAGFNRPRPPGPLAGAEGAAFPSGHAAYSTVWVAAALVLARSVPGLVKDAALVGGALLIAVGIGASRVYLRVHYWSDVAGGWALGALILGAAVAVALVVDHVRNNDGERSASAGGHHHQRA